MSSPPISESAFSRSQSLKGLRPIDIGSAVGGLLGAAAFFAVDGLNPSPANAQLEDGDDVTVYLIGPETKDGDTVLYGCNVDGDDSVNCYY